MDMYNIGCGDKYIPHTYDEIIKAAEDGLEVIDNYTGGKVRVAANYNGYVTVVTEKGIIYSAWAGCFTAA